MCSVKYKHISGNENHYTEMRLRNSLQRAAVMPVSTGFLIKIMKRSKNITVKWKDKNELVGT